MKTKVLEQQVGILTLAQQIGALHRDIEGRREEMYGLLTQAKKDAGEGGWLRWLSENEAVLGFGERQARYYLREPEARASDQARHAEGERKRRAAAKATKEKPTEPATESKPGEVDYEDGAQPEDETNEVLKGIAGKRKPEAEPTQGLEAVEAAGSYLGELVKVSNSIISQIKETVKAKHGVSTKGHEAATKAVEKLREALATIAPRWKCEECSDVLEPGGEPDSRYECGECGDTMKENPRCESCNKFAMKVSDVACPMEDCNGEMVLVGWETAIDLIAAQVKKNEEAERKESAERAAKEKFAKTKAGKAEAAKKAAEDKAYDAARLKEDEDRTLELARLITKGRAAGKTTEQVKREEEKATRAENKARWAAWAAQGAAEESAGDPAAAEPESRP